MEKEDPSVMDKVHEMLVKWEEGDPAVRALWQMMNEWVFEGFEQTYKALGISFDKTDYEHDTYLLGKELVQKGLDMGVFVKDPDGSVWCDLTADGLDRKLLLRSDGTSVYITQDLGTAERRFSEYKLDSLIYVVGDEQNYHFQVLKLILKKLGFSWADCIYHLSYGMVELPEGKMKSREGTVVDADDLIEKMYQEAKEMSEESGKLAEIPQDEKERLYRMIGLGALKYFILKVDPKKKMLFYVPLVSLVSSAVFCLIGYVLADNIPKMLQILSAVGEAGWIALGVIAAAVAVYVIYRFIRKKQSRSK